MRTIVNALLTIGFVFFLVLVIKYGYYYFIRKIPLTDIDKAFDNQGILFRIDYDIQSGTESEMH